MAYKLSPFVYWGQSTSTISLKVDLRNVENVEVTLTEESLDFSAQGQGVKGLNSYGFHLDFYLPVDPEAPDSAALGDIYLLLEERVSLTKFLTRLSLTRKSRYRKTDLAVEFQIEKAAGETWPRLTSERLKLPWLKIDFDKFPLDDSEGDDESESENAKESQEELIRKITEDLEAEPTMGKPSMTQTYLFFYNLFQFVGYTYIFIILIYSYIKDGDSAKQGAVEMVGTQMIVCQLAAMLEIIHPLLGLVKSNVIMSLAQVLGRNFILFILVLQEPRLQISPLCWYLFVVWSAVEVIRYPFYLLQLVDIQIKYLTWLRYTIWIPLYPLGILVEATIVFQSISYFSETGFFSIALPNYANFAFFFPYFLMAYLVIICIGGTNNMKYMYLQRQKQVSGVTRSSSKHKHS